MITKLHDAGLNRIVVPIQDPKTGKMNGSISFNQEQWDYFAKVGALYNKSALEMLEETFRFLSEAGITDDTSTRD